MGLLMSEIEEPIKFACTGCGACCKRVGQALEVMRGLGFPYNVNDDGACEMLDENNQCKVYDNRPEACNIEAMYQRYHSKVNNRKKIFFEEATICNTFVKMDGLDNKYLIDTKQYER